jgi:hypothetical protein
MHLAVVSYMYTFLNYPPQIKDVLGGMDVWRHAFFTFALDGGELSASLPGRFIPRGKTPPASIG